MIPSACNLPQNYGVNIAFVKFNSKFTCRQVIDTNGENEPQRSIKTQDCLGNANITGNEIGQELELTCAPDTQSGMTAAA